MTFYNPNIQRTFDEHKKEFIQLRGVTFAEYKIIYSASEDWNVMDIKSLHFVRFQNKHQQSNLLLVDRAFPSVLAEITLAILAGTVHTFAESISSVESIKTADNEYEPLYFDNKISQFLELLLYSDIASKHPSVGVLNFNRIYSQRHSADELEHYTLYNRLKLFEYLKREMILEINTKESTKNETEVTLCLRIRL